MENEKNELENKEELDTPVQKSSTRNMSEQEKEDMSLSDKDLQTSEETATTEDNENKPSSVVKEIISWVKVIVFALVLSIILNKFVFFNFTVPTESMENTIMVDNKIMSLRCAYLFSDPQRGDIIVFPFPDDPEETYIKRIIGLPGETVEGKDGLVYINGVALEEEYVTSDIDDDFGPYEIPEDSYFVLGDNRDISLDARYWENKFVKREDIISKAILRFYPGIKLLK